LVERLVKQKDTLTRKPTSRRESYGVLFKCGVII
jgi:hypothetical protein